MAGTSATTFDPEMNLTRAMTAQILYNLEGKPEVTEDATFTDIDTAPDWSFGRHRLGPGHRRGGRYGGEPVLLPTSRSPVSSLLR